MKKRLSWIYSQVSNLLFIYMGMAVVFMAWDLVFGVQAPLLCALAATILYKIADLAEKPIAKVWNWIARRIFGLQEDQQFYLVFAMGTRPKDPKK